jgi:hypothetical protein
MITASAEVQTYLGLSAMNPLATLVQGLAEQHVKDFLGVEELEQQTWVEYYPLDQGASGDADPQYTVDSGRQRAVPGLYLTPNTIQLRNLPVRSITEVREDATGYFGQTPGGFGPATILQPGGDYFLKQEQAGLSWSGHLVRRSFWFPATLGSVMVTYVAGFTAEEFAGRWRVFKTAVLETAADLYLRGKAISLGQRPGIAAESLGGGASASYVNERLAGVPTPDPVAEMLQPYVNYGEANL